MPRVDFSNVTDFKPIPEGTYDVTLSGAKVIAESKSSGQPYVELTFTVAEGEYAGRRLFRNFSLQPQALWAFKKGMVRLGSDPDNFVGELDLSDIEMLCADCVGSPARIVVALRDYEGQQRNDVKTVLGPEF